MMYINLSDNGILSLKCSDYRCIISLISKNEAIWIWLEKWNIINLKNDFLKKVYIKMEKTITKFYNFMII